MQETLYQTADAGDSLCMSLSRQRMQGVSLSDGVSDSAQEMQEESLYQTADADSGAGDSLLDSGCRSLSIRQGGDSLSDSGCRGLSIRQRMQDAGDSLRHRMQESLSGCSGAGDSLSDSKCISIRQGCRRHSIRKRMQEYLN